MLSELFFFFFSGTLLREQLIYPRPGAWPRWMDLANGQRWEALRAHHIRGNHSGPIQLSSHYSIALPLETNGRMDISSWKQCQQSNCDRV